MNALRLVAAIVLAFLSLWIMTMNWTVFWRRHIQRHAHVSSWIPLLGGGLGAFALILSPAVVLRGWWWIPLCVDWGSLPGLAYSVFWNLCQARNHKAKPNESNPNS